MTTTSCHKPRPKGIFTVLHVSLVSQRVLWYVLRKSFRGAHPGDTERDRPAVSTDVIPSFRAHGQRSLQVSQALQGIGDEAPFSANGFVASPSLQLLRSGGCQPWAVSQRDTRVPICSWDVRGG